MDWMNASRYRGGDKAVGQDGPFQEIGIEFSLVMQGEMKVKMKTSMIQVFTLL